MADCSLTTLVQQSKCFICFSETERLALKVYFLAQALKAQGGPDYTNINVLRQAEQCINCMPLGQEDAVDVLINQRLALNLSAANVNLTTAQLRAQIKCLVCVNRDEMIAMLTLLRCQMNKFIGTGAL